MTIPENTRLIPLTQGKFAIVDADDYEKLSQFSWCANKRAGYLFYAQSSIKGKREYMHRVVMNAKKGQQIDHINGNSLDNRKKNLRFCSCSENQMNSRKRKNKSSKFKGVFWHNGLKKWAAKISVGGKQKRIGVFINEEDAAKAYDVAAKEKCGGFASTNF